MRLGLLKPTSKFVYKEGPRFESQLELGCLSLWSACSPRVYMGFLWVLWFRSGFRPDRWRVFLPHYVDHINTVSPLQPCNSSQLLSVITNVTVKTIQHLIHCTQTTICWGETNTFELKYYLNKKKIKKSLAFPGHQIH